MFKTFDPTKDISYSDREVFTYAPMSGSIYESGTLGENNKTFKKSYPNQIYSGSTSGSFFLTYYDRAVTDSDAVELFDMTFGFSISSSFYSTATVVKEAKNRIYKHFSEMCWGNKDNRFVVGSTYYDELYFVHFKRSIIQDEIRKGYCTLYTVFADDTGHTGSVDKYPITDATARSQHYEAKGGSWQYLTGPSGTAGWVFYDLGLMALIPSGTFGFADDYHDFSASNPYNSAVNGNTIDNIVAYTNEKWDVAAYTHPVQLYAEQTIQSALYLCSAGLKEFNYSSNPTYVDTEGRIVMTSGSKSTKAASYMTTIALYGANNELLGVAKLSEPIKKASDTAPTFTVRVNY